MELKTKSYIAFFDLDKTILSINSGSRLVREAHHRKLMSTADFLKAIYFSFLYKFHLRDTDRIISGMGQWLRGIPAAEVEKLSLIIVKKYLIAAIRPEILDEIKFHKESDAEVVILSSAITEICIPLKDHIGFDNVICTKMKIENGYFSGLPENNFCFENEKRIRLEEYCKINNYKPEEAFYYGDSIADLPPLESVGHPVCISPDRKLCRIAMDKGWEIKNWN
jgi:HAD superfamily hydrolase (TIGR01490 family)